MHDASHFLTLGRRELIASMAQGHPIDPAALDDSDYKGTSLGLPRWVERLTWKKFRKVFRRDPESGRLHGWNVRLEQNGLNEPCVPKLRRGEPITFGPYGVVSAEGVAMPRPCNQGLLIDYSLGGGSGADPTSLLRDPIVAVNSGDPRLLLGWTYLALGRRGVSTPSFFTLEREE